MDNTLYVGLSRQMTLARQLELAANNMANIDTAGFKVENLMLQSDPLNPVRGSGFSPIRYVIDDGVARDFRPGELSQTGNPLDVAIEGDAFFQVKTPQGTRYTRDGRFTLDEAGVLKTQSGYPVLDGSGSEITLDPKKGQPTISKQGGISQDGVAGPKIGVVRFARRSQLSKQGDNLYASPETPAAASDANIRQGLVERSNVNSVSEVTNLIEITRAYERINQMMSATEDLNRQAVERLGKAA